MNDTQTQSELHIFTNFAEVCPLRIVRSSISKRNPPEPDILCNLAETNEHVAFELVEIIDNDWARLTSGQFREGDALREAYRTGSQDLRRELNQRLGNALVYVSFVPEVQARQRRAAVPEILQRLSTMAPDFVGQWRPAHHGTLDGVVRFITITRGDFPGPEFDVEAVGAIGDPTLERIRAKWSKPYSTRYPIELLAYFELQPLAPEALWRYPLESFLTTSWESSPFRRLWVFDVASRTIPYSAACESTGRLTAHAPDGAA